MNRKFTSSRLNTNKGYITTFLLLIAGFLASFVQREPESISVKVTPTEITIEGKEIKHDEFEQELKKVVDSKVKQGLKRDDLFVRLFVDPNVKRGMLADIEVSMRRLNIRKILYSTIQPERQGG